MFAKDSLSTNAKGGTELQRDGLIKNVDSDLLDNFQIYLSRVEEPFDDNKIRILWHHDLPGDPSAKVLENGGWRNFHKIVFVSNWQMQGFIQMYGIPWENCIVMQNAIEPLIPAPKSIDVIKLGYWSTPHRGLQILVPVFNKLRETHGSKIELDVYSSFGLYGWEQKDKEFEELFDKCRNSEGINYHGAVDNSIIRENIKDIHILAYPSIWSETSCMVLMEAMAAGLNCVHPNFGALYETAVGLTNMYQFHEDINKHAGLFYHVLNSAIENHFDEGNQSKLGLQSTYANAFYTWDTRKTQWKYLLQSLINVDRSLPKKKFSYSS